MRHVRMQEREAILKLHAGSLPLADDVALPALATACHGYSGADLAALCREAAMTALSDAASAMLAGQTLAACTHSFACRIGGGEGRWGGVGGGGWVVECFVAAAMLTLVFFLASWGVAGGGGLGEGGGVWGISAAVAVLADETSATSTRF